MKSKISVRLQIVSSMEKKYYRSFPEYCKETFGRKLYRVALDAGMSCPNRDGTIGKGGCIFCDEGGSGDFAIKYSGQKLDEEKLIFNHVKAGKGNYIAYFQSFTNTYAPVGKLRALFTSALSDDLFAGISIATRADCMGEEVISLLKELKSIFPDKFIWIELGLQTIHAKSTLFIRRGYPLSVFETCVKRLREADIPFTVHVILGLPYETKEMMIETVRYVNSIRADGIKLQLLHYLDDTDLGRMYMKDPSMFHVLTEDEYVDIVCTCIGYLSEDIVVHRLTGDGNGEHLLAPLWSSNKRHILNRIRHEMKVRNITQGSHVSSHF